MGVRGVSRRHEESGWGVTNPLVVDDDDEGRGKGASCGDVVARDAAGLRNEGTRIKLSLSVGLARKLSGKSISGRGLLLRGVRRKGLNLTAVGLDLTALASGLTVDTPRNGKAF